MKLGDRAFDSFHFALLEARHAERQDITDVGVLCAVAANCGLDSEAVRAAVSDRKMDTKLADDHTYASETLKAFGTPTLVFPGEKAVFLKMIPPTPPEEATSVFNEVRDLALSRPNILEIKRPG